MHAKTLIKTISCCGLGGLVWLGCLADAHAGTALCPPFIEVPADTATGFAFAPVTLKGGQCTTLPGFVDPGAFSGAALASQALTDLSQTTTQETSRNTVNKISERREAEEQRCAEGFTRVDGECRRILSPAPKEAAVVEAQPMPLPTAPRKKGKKSKGAAEEQPVSVPKGAHHEGLAPISAPKIVRRPAPPAMVCKDGPCAPPPILIEPAARFGTWTQVYGDYEHRDASGGAFVLTGLVSPELVPLGISVQSRTGTVGFQIGGDFTTRGILFANDGLIFGAMAGYVSSNLTLNTSSLSTNLSVVGNGSSHMNATLSGPTAGLYATYFDGGFSTDLLLKTDILALNENFSDFLAFTNAGAGPSFVPFAGSGSVNLIAATVAQNLNYRFNLFPNYWVEPTIGAQYTNTSYAGGAADLGLEDGTLVMIQGGARFGTNFLIGNSIRTTAILTGLAYDDVVVSGGFIPGASFVGNNILAHADQGHVRGRGLLAFNFDFDQGVSAFILGDVRGGQGLFGAGGKAGIRYQW